MKKIKLLSILAICLTANTSTAQCKPSIFLPFNGNAQDASGNGQDGVVVGATLTADRNGKTNNAYYFDGLNDHIVVPDDTANDLGKSWTIMAWIKPDAGYGSFKDNHVSVVEKWGNAGSGLAAYGMGIHANGELEGFTHTGSSGTYQWSSTSVKINVWTHVAVTRSSDDSIRLYINGTLNKTYISVTPQNSSFDLFIGMAADPSIRSTYPDKYRFKGIIDDVKIYKCALVPSQFSTEIIEYIDYGQLINISPNPSNGIFHIEQNVSKNYEVKIFDMNGKLIQSGINQPVFDLGSAKGVYCIQFLDMDLGFTVNKKILLTY
jgi:hypothetical protein